MQWAMHWSCLVPGAWQFQCSVKVDEYSESLDTTKLLIHSKIQSVDNSDRTLSGSILYTVKIILTLRILLDKVIQK